MKKRVIKKVTHKKVPKNILSRKPARTRKVARTTLIPEYYCRHCGHKWLPRTNFPDECPNCKSRNWLNFGIKRKGDIHR